MKQKQTRSKTTMASKPGFLTDWPWKSLGNFKYVLLVPCAFQCYHSFMDRGGNGINMATLIHPPFLLFRLLHSQIWISLSRFQSARSKHRILSKSLEFDQVDRERNWDDQVIFTGVLIYFITKHMPHTFKLPLWNTNGVIMVILLHMGPVEFIYYWGHRALHHHFLYSRYHSHHHSSFVTEPITSVIHPFAEHLFYFLLFGVPQMYVVFAGTASIATILGYITYIDFMNYMGHCNFEFIPKWLFRFFPFLKFFMYTPSFHSLHHTQFKANYCLFMPIYDYIYGTTDKSSDLVYETSLEGKEEMVDMVHLTHLTNLHSIYQLRLGFASLASKPYSSKWYLWALWPVTYGSVLLTWAFGGTFTLERNRLGKVTMQTWTIPRYNFQYRLGSQKGPINSMIDKAIIEAEAKGVKVISLGLLNQSEELNKNGEFYVDKHPELKIRIVDGSTLAAAVVINSIPEGVTQVLLKGNLTKTGFAIALALCQRGVRVITSSKTQFERMKLGFPADLASCVVFSYSHDCKVWLVGDGMKERQQWKAHEGTLIIPFSVFPLKKLREDCIYLTTPAMIIPKTFENMHSCENWLPRRVMSAWRVGGIVHALEGWDEHECGNTMLDCDKVWRAALHHGFIPL